MTANPQDLDALVGRADIMAEMMRMGERIVYVTDADMICALSAAITTLRRDLLAAEAAATERAAKACDDTVKEAMSAGDQTGRSIAVWFRAQASELRDLITHEATTALDAVKREAEERGIQIGLRAAAEKLRSQGYGTAVRQILAIAPDEARKMGEV